MGGLGAGIQVKTGNASAEREEGLDKEVVEEQLCQSQEVEFIIKGIRVLLGALMLGLVSLSRIHELPRGGSGGASPGRCRGPTFPRN